MSTFASFYDRLTVNERRVIQAIPKTSRTAGNKLLNRIKRRTTSGRDVRGRFFKGYSALYAQREKGGRLAPVTLIGKGTMIRDYRSFPTRSGVELRARTRKQDLRGWYHYAGRGNNPEREWFGASHRDRKIFFKDWKADVLRQMPRGTRTRRMVLRAE